MDGVSAVRAYTLLAVLALVAGSVMLNTETAPATDPEPDGLSFDETAQQQAAEDGDDGSSGDADSGEESGDAPPELRSAENSDNDVDSASDGLALSRGLLAGGAGALGSLAAGSIIFEAMRVTVLIALAAPMLARMKSNRDDMMTRGRMLGYLEANAGIHFSALRDGLGLANGVSAYHLHTLENQGQIISWRDGKLRRYAVASLSKEELTRIRNPIAGTRLAILEVLAESGHLGLPGKEIKVKLEISRQLLSHHLAELRSAELVEAASDARRPNWRLSDIGIDVLLTSRQVARTEAAA